MRISDWSSDVCSSDLGETSPPNFLAGSGAQVTARLRHSAPRLYVRLAMWHRDMQHREKTPMPPPFPSATGKVATAPRQTTTLARIPAAPLREEHGRAPRTDAYLSNGYETLPHSLHPATTYDAAARTSTHLRTA